MAATDFFSLGKGDPNDPPVLLIHGLLGAARNLYRLVQETAKSGFHAVAHDQRGHGHSPWSPDGRYTIPDLARDVIAIMDSKGIPSAHLVGHSLGGRVALATAALEPTRVKSIGMLDVGPRIGPNAFKNLKDIVDPLPLSFPSKEEAVEFVKRYPDPGIQQFLLANLHTKEDRLTWLFDLNGIRDSLLPSLQIDQHEDWRRLKTPALVLRGENSAHFRQEEMDLMLAQHPGAKAAVVENAGHWVHVDNFGDTAKAVIDFLRQVKT